MRLSPFASRVHRQLVEDLIVEWQHSGANEQRRPADEYFADHPLVRDRPELRAELLRALADISCFERPTNDRPSLENLPELPGYEIEEFIGAGGMGVVYRARDRELDRFVAVKILHGGQWADPSRRRRFAIEAKVVAQLEHENIIRLYQVGESRGLPYLVVEHVPGGNLDEHWGDVPQEPLQVARLVEILARAIHHTHKHPKRIIHRDLKPTNVLLSAAGEPKVADFGLAKMLDGDAALSRTGECLGTAQYMAPEQLEGRSDERTDVYGLGAILYRGLTGRSPFIAGSITDVYRMVASESPVAPRKLVRGIDRDIETICQKCLEKSPDKRYASADELARDLRRYLDGLPIRARQAGPLERTWRFVRTNPQIAVTIAVLLLAVVVTGWGLVRAERSHRDAVAAISALLDSLDAKTDIVRQDESLKRDDLYEFRTSLLKAVLAQYQALLVDGRPATVDPVRLARALEKVGGIEQDLGDLASARTAYLGAATEWQKLAEKSDPTGDFRDAQIDALCDAATAESSLSLTDEAKAHASLALALGKDRLAANPQSSRALARVARCYQTFGVIEGSRNQYRDALVFQREALAIRRQIVEREPTAESRFELAEILRAIGLSRHKTDEASTPIRAVFNEALQEVRSALRDEPRQLKYRQLEGRILSNRGMSDRRPEVAEGDPQFLAAYERAMRNSEATLIEAVAVRRKLAEDYPAYAIHHHGLAVVLGNLADTYMALIELGVEEPKREHLLRTEAQAIYAKLYARRPEVIEYREGLFLHTIRLARVLHYLGRDAEAGRLFQEVVDAKIPVGTLENNPNDLCTAAICWSLMAASSPKTKDGRPDNISRVVECLQLALDHHFARIPWAASVVENEPAFAVYRYEPEFQQVMSRFEAERRRWMRQVSAESDEIAQGRQRR